MIGAGVGVVGVGHCWLNVPRCSPSLLRFQRVHSTRDRVYGFQYRLKCRRCECNFAPPEVRTLVADECVLCCCCLSCCVLCVVCCMLCVSPMSSLLDNATMCDYHLLQLLHCRYHPQSPVFESSSAPSTGVYPCCNARVLRCVVVCRVVSCCVMLCHVVFALCLSGKQQIVEHSSSCLPFLFTLLSSLQPSLSYQ